MFRDVVTLRQKFAPKFVELAKRAARDGEPIMRNLEYNYPGVGYAGVLDEFMMGTDLLVAPVLTKGADSRRVKLPPGNWRGDDGTLVTGPAEVTIMAHLGRLPYFTKE